MDLNDVICFMACWVHVSSNLQKNKCFFEKQLDLSKAVKKKKKATGNFSIQSYIYEN